MNLIKLLFFFLALTGAQRTSFGQNPSDHGYLIFNMGANSMDCTRAHIAHIIACDTIIKINDLNWNTQQQIRDHIPYGYHGKNRLGRSKYLSKYYIASPPVFNGNPKNPDTHYNIGLVTPDELWLDGEKPAQLVYMDYAVLDLMYIEYFPFTYDTTFQGLDSILVPFQVECADFPWNAESGVPGAEGASGIGYFYSAPKDTNQLFLPYDLAELLIEGEKPYYVKNYLDCKVTLLNDVLSDHELRFVVNDFFVTESINLLNYVGTKVKIELTRIRRDELPCGCKIQSGH